jgi:hypothetical protein
VSSPSSARSNPTQDFRFVARQPILNREQQVFGLLFRDGVENFFRAIAQEAAARQTLDSTLLMGFGVCATGSAASSTVPANCYSRTASPCCLRARWWLLDDYVANDPGEAMVPLTDIIQVV